MHDALLEDTLWLTALLGEVALFGVLLRKGRWRLFPAFTALIFSVVIASCLEFGLQRAGATSWYAIVYWAYAPVNVLLQIAVVIEIARIVLRPTGTWVRDAQKQFFSVGAAGAIIAIIVACLVVPPAGDRLQVWELRANLFTSLLICELMIAVSSASNRLGLGWKNHVMAVGQGLMAWSMAAVMVDSLHSFFGTARFFISADYLQDVVYIGSLGYWSVHLWRAEPARQPISPQLRKFIVALHERVQYDLGEAEQ